MTTQPTASRPRSAAIFPVRRPRFDGPIAQEIRAGLTRIAAEINRMAARVRIRRELRLIDLEEIRAAREIHWLREELTHHEQNLTWLEYEHSQRREKLIGRLQQLAGGPQ